MSPIGNSSNSPCPMRNCWMICSLLPYKKIDISQTSIHKLYQVCKLDTAPCLIEYFIVDFGTQILIWTCKNLLLTPQNIFYLITLQGGGLKLPLLVYEWGYPKHKNWWGYYGISTGWFWNRGCDSLCPVIHCAPTPPTATDTTDTSTHPPPPIRYDSCYFCWR